MSQHPGADVERRKPNQEEWTYEEWINVSADELAGRAWKWKQTPSPSLPPTMGPTRFFVMLHPIIHFAH